MGVTISSGKGNGIIGKLIFTGFGLFFAFIGSLFAKQAWQSLQETKAMQQWAQTSCTIISSEVEDDGEDFKLAVSYSYSVEGKTYTAERYGHRTCYTAETLGEIDRVRKRLAPGKTVGGHYNPAHPAEAVLDLSTVKNARRALGFTLLFPAFGLFFASIPWLRSRKNKSAQPGMEPKSTECAGKLFMVAFGLVFALVGLLAFKAMFLTPLQQTREAKAWTEAAATVVSSKVKSHTGDDSTTYSPYIAYRYEINGEDYLGDRYSFIGGSSSGYDSKAAIVGQYPQGRAITIYYDPANPAESVINRDASKNNPIGLIPLVFTLVGVVVMASAFRMKKAALDPRQAQERIVTLKAASPAGKALGLMAFTLVWNGVVYFLIKSDAPRLFPILFGFFGMLMIGASIHAILALFNPRPTVEITPGDIRPGTSVALRWRLSGRADRIGTLSIKLQCLKITTQTSGSGEDRSTHVAKTSLHESQLLQTQSQPEITQGTLQFTIPQDLPTSRPGNTDGIRWQVLFHGDIARWPDMKEELPFTVYPNG